MSILAFAQNATTSINYCNPELFSKKKISDTIFKKIEFNCEVKFSGVTFDSTSADFNKSTFFKPTEFKHSFFQHKTEFRVTGFHAFTDFKSTHFYKPTYFVSTKFLSGVNFKFAEFHDHVNFESAVFDSIANFTEVRFKAAVSFDQIILPNLLVFEDISTDHIIDLTKSKINPDKKANNKQQFCFINLFNAPIEKIKLRYDNFRIYRPDSVSNNPITPETFEKLSNVYESLLKNFKDYGYVTSYEKLDIEYQKFKFTKRPNRNSFQIASGHILNWLNKNWNNYGHDKTRIWYITLLFFVVFSFINWCFFRKLVTKAYSIDTFKTAYNQNRKRTFFNISSKNLILTLYYTALIFFGLNLKIEKLNFNYPTLIALVFLQYTIGLVCLAYLANFVINSNLIGG